VLLASLSVFATAQAPVYARPPNVVIFYADDMGIGDIGCYGCTDIRTPSLDALAASGVRLTNYYSAAPICSPSRAALLTGRTPARAGLSLAKNISSKPGEPGMSAEEITIAELARTRGYATAAIGKWHLGYSRDTQPNGQGFDLFFGFHSSLTEYFSHMNYWEEPYHHDLFRNREEVFENGVHMTDLITRETVEFIEQNRGKPFLVYVAYNAPHYPMVAQTRFLRAYGSMPEPRRSYAALVAGMDESVGRILERLRGLGLERDTLVFFSSDNGAAAASPRGEGGGSNGPFREGKRSLFEGGIRMPAIVRWPGTVGAGQTRNQLAVAMDVFVTIADAIGAEIPADRTFDGRSWLPMLKDAGAPCHETLFFEWDGQQAVRQGKWKLVRNGLIDLAASRQKRAAGDDAVFLSDLDADPGETKNLRSLHPDVAARLLALHDDWRAAIAKDLAARSKGTESRQ